MCRSYLGKRCRIIQVVLGESLLDSLLQQVHNPLLQCSHTRICTAIIPLNWIVRNGSCFTDIQRTASMGKCNFVQNIAEVKCTSQPGDMQRVHEKLVLEWLTHCCLPCVVMRDGAINVVNDVSGSNPATAERLSGPGSKIVSSGITIMLEATHLATTRRTLHTNAHFSCLSVLLAQSQGMSHIQNIHDNTDLW